MKNYYNPKDSYTASDLRQLAADKETFYPHLLAGFDEKPLVAVSVEKKTQGKAAQKNQKNDADAKKESKKDSKNDDRFKAIDFTKIAKPVTKKAQQKKREKDFGPYIPTESKTPKMEKKKESKLEIKKATPAQPKTEEKKKEEEEPIKEMPPGFGNIVTRKEEEEKPKD